MVVVALFQAWIAAYASERRRLFKRNFASRINTPLFLRKLPYAVRLTYMNYLVDRESWTSDVQISLPELQ